jgi:glycosyltransferase involved in cell wall biosynthesis
MNIYIDNIIFSLQKAGGISVFFSECINGLSATGNNITLINQKENSNIFYKDIKQDALNVILENNIPSSIARYLNVKQKFNSPSILHSSYYRISKSKNVVNVLSVYDFNYERNLCGQLPKLIHSTQKRHAIKNSDVIICISESTKSDLIKFYPFVNEKIIKVVYLACDSRFSVSREDLLVQHKFNKLEKNNFVMFVGSRKNHKNFNIAIKAVEKNKELILAMVGGGEVSKNEKEILGQKLNSRYVHLKYLSVNSLNNLYNNAFCLIYPSSYEGFGIPILEAMQSGCPVITTDRASIPEVCGDACIQITEITPENFSLAMQRLNNKRYREEVIKKGIKQSQKFSWDKTTKEILSIYAESFQRKFG